jgi:very-short-patch-repair endonuclease
MGVRIARVPIVAIRVLSTCQELLEVQHGVIARWQVAQAGQDVRVVDPQLHNGRWQPLYRGVYATFTGRPSRDAWLWGAVLRAGPGAALSYDTAAELDRLADKPSTCIHVTVSPARQITLSGRECEGSAPKIILHRSTRLHQARHPVRTPPRTRIEETTLDLIQVSPSIDQALAWLASACGRRLTTPERLLGSMVARSRLRWRAQLVSALADVGNGVHSVLEWHYVRDVERGHGLPRANRQVLSRIGGRTRYLDNHYQEFGVAVELDGLAAHPADARWRDIRRDNACAEAGIVTLRYGWSDVTQEPCRVAAEIARVLRRHGWKARPHPCGPGCAASSA